MPINTNYDPQNINDFEKTKLNKAAVGITGIAIAGTTTNIDYTFTDDSLISKGRILIDGAVKGDRVDIQIVHPVYGVVLTAIKDWYIDWTCVKQETPESNYPAKAFAGLKIRLAYHSCGTTDVWIGFNLDKEKILE